MYIIVSLVFTLYILLFCDSTELDSLLLNRTVDVNFIIAGTQKSGTTVMAALLSDHPLIVFSKQKEVHYFDKIENYRKGLGWYRSLFSINSAPESSVQLGEATPFYIASRKACARIGETIPRAKLIILLRDPVARAYSEYNMKKRRVAAQDEFLFLIGKFELQVYTCMVQYSLNFEAINGCLPRLLSEHNRFSKLVTAWKRAFAKTEDWDSVINFCFPGHSRLVNEFMRNGLYKDDNSFKNSNFLGTINAGAFNASGFVSPANVLLPSGEVAKLSFNATSCWNPHYKAGLETVKTLREAMMGEITAFRRCRVTIQHSTNISNIQSEVEQRLERLDQAVDRCIKVQGGISTQYFYRSMYAVQLFHCFKHIPREQFMILPSGRLRREPAAVLREVLAFLQVPPDPSMADVVGDDSTASSADPALSSLFVSTSVVGVGVDGGAEVDTAAAAAAAATTTIAGKGGDVDLSISSVVMSTADQQVRIRAMVEKHFPRFAVSTGWDFESTYEPLPEYLSEYMHNFYAEQNQLLFQLLNQTFEDAW